LKVGWWWPAVTLAVRMAESWRYLAWCAGRNEKALKAS